MDLVRLVGAIIAVLEGLRLTAYPDSGGVWTIGYGRAHGVTKGMVITLDQALQFLAEDASPLIELVKQHNFPLVKSAALVSFGYNCGKGALERVLSGSLTVTAEGFLDPKDGKLYGQVDRKGNLVDHLVRRRRFEAALILAA